MDLLDNESAGRSQSCSEIHRVAPAPDSAV